MKVRAERAYPCRERKYDVAALQGDDSADRSLPGLRPKPSLYVCEEAHGKVGEADDAPVPIIAPDQDKLRQAVTRIEDSSEDRLATPRSARSKGKREMANVGVDDHEEPLTNYRRQGGVGV